MTIVWTSRALDDLAAVHARIAADDPGAAATLIGHILSLVEDTLAHQPMMGRPGRVAGTRELLTHPNYILVYRVTPEALQILTVRHAARLWPDHF